MPLWVDALQLRVRSHHVRPDVRTCCIQPCTCTCTPPYGVCIQRQGGTFIRAIVVNTLLESFDWEGWYYSSITYRLYMNNILIPMKYEFHEHVTLSFVFFPFPPTVASPVQMLRQTHDSLPDPPHTPISLQMPAIHLILPAGPK